MPSRALPQCPLPAGTTQTGRWSSRRASCTTSSTSTTHPRPNGCAPVAGGCAPAPAPSLPARVAVGPCPISAPPPHSPPAGGPALRSSHDAGGAQLGPRRICRPGALDAAAQRGPAARRLLRQRRRVQRIGHAAHKRHPRHHVHRWASAGGAGGRQAGSSRWEAGHDLVDRGASEAPPDARRRPCQDRRWPPPSLQACSTERCM